MIYRGDNKQSITSQKRNHYHQPEFSHSYYSPIFVSIFELLILPQQHNLIVQTKLVDDSGAVSVMMCFQWLHRLVSFVVVYYFRWRRRPYFGDMYVVELCVLLLHSKRCHWMISTTMLQSMLRQPDRQYRPGNLLLHFPVMAAQRHLSFSLYLVSVVWLYVARFRNILKVASLMSRLGAYCIYKMAALYEQYDHIGLSMAHLLPMLRWHAQPDMVHWHSSLDPLTKMYATGVFDVANIVPIVAWSPRIYVPIHPLRNRV